MGCPEGRSPAPYDSQAARPKLASAPARLAGWQSSSTQPCQQPGRAGRIPSPSCGSVRYLHPSPPGLPLYTPRSFRVEDVATLHQLIRDYSFGTLVTQDGDRPVATHLPFMIDPSRGGPRGTLVSHMARANPHWKSWTQRTRVLTIFQGPHAYVSPGWYDEQRTVPTWNYATVHAYGTPRLIHDPDELRTIVTELVGLHEDAVDSGWDRSLMESVLGTELRAIVGFEVPIDSLEGKFKFSQNRSAADQLGVARGLEGSEDPLERSAAAIMRRNLERGE